MAALKTVLSVAFWAFPTFFACFWMATRVDAYFFRSGARRKHKPQSPDVDLASGSSPTHGGLTDVDRGAPGLEQGR